MTDKHRTWSITLDPWAASYLKRRAAQEKRAPEALLQEWAIDALEDRALAQFADECDEHEKTVSHEEAWGE